MSPSFRTFFKVVSVSRVLAIFLLVVLWVVWDLNHPASSTGSGIGLELSIWFYLFVYSFCIGLVANTIISLLISFKPKWMFTSFLRHKALLLFFYLVELIVLPFLIYRCYENVQETFFPETTVVGEVLKFLLKSTTGVDVYEKYEAVNLVLVTLSSFCFVLAFWKFYNARKKEYELSEQPA
jgi:hypothetical protein